MIRSEIRKENTLVIVLMSDWLTECFTGEFKQYFLLIKYLNDPLLAMIEWM